MYQYSSCFMIPWAFSSIVLRCYHKINLVCFKCICLSVHIWVWVWGRVHIHVHVYVGEVFVGQKITLAVIRIIVDPFRQSFSLVWSSPVRLTRLGIEFQGPSYLHLPATGIICAHPSPPLASSHGLWGIKLTSFWL